MSYKIALASSDGINIDLHFGSATSFLIYEVLDNKSFSLVETRLVQEDSEQSDEAKDSNQNTSCSQGAGCGSGGGCGSNGAGISNKVKLILDCRCVVCSKIGFNVTKQLEKNAIASFDVTCPIEDALNKIVKYFYSIDNHISLARR